MPAIHVSATMGSKPMNRFCRVFILLIFLFAEPFAGTVKRPLTSSRDGQRGQVFFQEVSISSSVRPLVSGTNARTNANENRLTIA